MDEFLTLIAGMLDPPLSVAVNRGRALLDASRNGDASAPTALFRLAADRASDYELYLDVLSDLDDTQIGLAVSADPSIASAVVQGVQQLHTGGHVTLEYGDVSQLTRWLLQIAHHAESIEAWALLEHTADAIFYLDSGWDRWDVHNDIAAWLSSRSGDAAGIAAQALRAHPDSIQHFEGLAHQANVDHRIRHVVNPASS